MKIKKGKHYLVRDHKTIIEIIDPTRETQIVVKTISGYDPRKDEPHRPDEWSLQKHHIIMKMNKERKHKKEIHDFINHLEYRARINPTQKLALKKAIREYRKESIKNAIRKIEKLKNT